MEIFVLIVDVNIKIVDINKWERIFYCERNIEDFF